MITNSFLTTPQFLVSPQPRHHLPLLVLMPGMDGTGDLWRSQLPQLEINFDVRRLRIPPHNLETWQGLSSQVIDLIKQEDLTSENSEKRQVYLCGESFGACLALQVAMDMPTLYDRLILINPASFFRQQPWLGWAGEGCRRLPESLYYLTTLAGLPFLAALERISPSDRRALLQAMQSVPQNTVAWRLEMLRDFQLQPPQLKQLTQPVLLVAGGHDRILPAYQEATHLSQYLPNSKIVFLPNSGHACMLEQEVSLDSILQQWQ